MAIHPTVEADNGNPEAAYMSPVDIEAWTEEAVQAIGHITISEPVPEPLPIRRVARGTSVTLQIPLDDHHGPAQDHDSSAAEAVRTGYVKRREPLRRDSLKRREALLKGKEGSRRRQRWENDRLLSNPYAQPPLPSDWEVRPTYPLRNVPYYLAPLWDAELAAKSATRNKTSAQTAKGAQNETGKVPKELKEKLKRSTGAKLLLQELEEEVRSFVESWEKAQKRAERQDDVLDHDSSDDEIVFVGRNGQMSDMPAPTHFKQPAQEKLLFHSPVDDQGACFGRWLVHHIGSYYGLRTWSVTTGNPARREAYIGVRIVHMKTGRKPSPPTAMPRPLWALV